MTTTPAHHAPAPASSSRTPRSVGGGCWVLAGAASVTSAVALVARVLIGA